jgi:hypothetical protein
VFPVNQLRSEFIYRDRLGLSPEQHRLLKEAGNAPPVHLSAGSFASAWRNYIKTLFIRGYWYRLSCSPSAILYVSESKTLAGKEERNYEGEAFGRKLAVTFFEDAGGGLVQRVDKERLALKSQLLTPAEILQSLLLLPANPDCSAADTELLLELRYEDLDIERFVGAVDADTDEVHIYRLGDPVNTEVAYAVEFPAHRTKMVLARCLQRSNAFDQEETLQTVWALPLAVLEARAAPHLPVPPVPAAPPVARGRGPRGRGRGRART